MGMIESNYCILTFGIFFRNNNFEGKNSQQRKICLLFKNVSNVLICLGSKENFLSSTANILLFICLLVFFYLQVVDFLLVMNEQHGEIGLQSQLSRPCGWRLSQQTGAPGTGPPKGGAPACPHTADVPPGGLLSLLCGRPRTSSQHSRGHLYFHQADNEETDQCFPRSCLLSGQSKGCLLHSNSQQLDYTNQTVGL